MEARKLRGSDVYQFTEELFAENMHLKRVESLARAVEGTLKAGSLGVCAIGQGLAAARHLDKKHAVKQVDRLMSNKKLDVDQLAPDWVGYVVGNKTEVVINMDWTEFDECNHSMLVMAAQTGQGRSTPLLWKTIKKSELTGKRNGVEDALIERLRELIPVEVKVTIVADRGFCDTKLYELLMELGFDFVISLAPTFWWRTRSLRERRPESG